MTMSRHSLVVLLAACSAGTPSQPMPDAADVPPPPGFYVAPDGHDDADGSFEAPFATVGRALDAMRGSSEKHTYLRGGVYPQRGQTIALDTRDTSIELLAYPGEVPVLSGGFPVTGWTQIDALRNIWAADLPADLPAVGAVTIDGTWLDVARTPNRDPADAQAHDSWFFVEQSLGPPVANPWDPSFGQDHAFTYRGSDLAAGIDGEPDAWISIWDKFGWSADILEIQSIDHASRAVTLEAASQFGLAPNSRYFVYGVRSGLDAPGEYYIDHAANQLLVIPPAGGDPNSQHIVASAYNGPAILSIDGADNVHIAGLELRDQHNTARWGVDTGGGIKVVSGNNAWIEHDTLRALGVGIDIEAGTGHRVEHNAIHDIACTGIVMYGDGNAITGNEIHDVGLVEQASHGILVGPGRNVIAHNHIANVPHYGIIEVGDKADGLVIEYNVLDHVDLGANDAGAIYLKNRGTYNPAAREQVRYNAIHGSGGLAVNTDTTFGASAFSFGIYLDDGQSGTDVYGNLFVGTSAGAVFPHNGTDNHVYNNVIVDGVNEQLFLESSNSPANNVFERNILVSSRLVPAIVEKYQGQQHTLRDNLFFDATAYYDQAFFAYGDGSTLTFAQARDAGLVTGSVVADPQLADPAHGDYHLRPGSPAFALGFQELPYEQMGP